MIDLIQSAFIGGLVAAVIVLGREVFLLRDIRQSVKVIEAWLQSGDKD